MQAFIYKYIQAKGIVTGKLHVAKKVYLIILTVILGLLLNLFD